MSTPDTSNAGYIDFDITDDPDVIAQLAYDQMRLLLPDWDPIVGEIDTTMIQAVARIASQIRASAGIVPISVFRYLAQQFGLTPAEGAKASCLTNWLFNDNDPHTIPAGTQIIVTDGFGIMHGFELGADLVETDGDGEADAVQIQAIDIGSGDNFLNTGTLLAALASPLGYVGNITIITDSAGGRDSQDDQQFLDSLVGLYQLFAKAPILPNDFAVFAVLTGSGAARAVTIDGLDPVANTTGNARTTCTAVVDVNGNPLSDPAMSDIVAAMDAAREVNFINFVVAPDVNDVSVTYTAHALPGYDTGTLTTAINGALSLYLSPASWGLPSTALQNKWTLGEGWDKVRRGELYQVINAVPGVAYVDTLFLKAGAILPTTEVADITLTGHFPLANLATVSGTVS